MKNNVYFRKYLARISWNEKTFIFICREFKTHNSCSIIACWPNDCKHTFKIVIFIYFLHQQMLLESTIKLPYTRTSVCLQFIVCCVGRDLCSGLISLS